jgi:hypothetical protein
MNAQSRHSIFYWRQAVNIKSQKDFFSGLMFMGVGVAFAWGATTYNVGEGARMGPGYFPLMLGILMAILGIAITFKSLVVETEGGDKIGKWAWKPLVFVILANLVFGVLLGGLPSIKLPGQEYLHTRHRACSGELRRLCPGAQAAVPGVA